MSVGGAQQVSVSHSRRDVLRGLHISQYAKLVTVLSGRIHDVICDLRPTSSSFGHWFSVELSRENGKQLFVPPGVAHGFMCMDDATILYVQGGTFNPRLEVDVNAFDATLAIFWPKPQDRYIMSAKDQSAQSLKSFIPTSITDAPMLRVMVIGANGQLGQAVMNAYGTAAAVIGTYNQNKNTKFAYHLDLSTVHRKRTEFESLLMSTRPHVVFVCAGLTWVDGCEKDPTLARAINGEAPGFVAASARRIGAKTVYFSTDYVFDGEVDKHLVESDTVRPLNIYGETKLLGEEGVLCADPRGLVIRTTGLYGPDLSEKNFVYQLCRALSSRRKFKCPNDQLGAPTYTTDLARVAKQLVVKDACGIFHCVGPNIVSRYELAVLIAEHYGLCSELIIPITTEEQYEDARATLGTAARRGKYLGMISERLAACLGSIAVLRAVPEALSHWERHPSNARLPFTPTHGQNS